MALKEELQHFLSLLLRQGYEIHLHRRPCREAPRFDCTPGWLMREIEGVDGIHLFKVVEIGEVHLLAFRN